MKREDAAHALILGRAGLQVFVSEPENVLSKQGLAKLFRSVKFPLPTTATGGVPVA
jgi:hypothetical protein